MIVCIAEKPSVARDIARILGANHRIGRGTGYMEGNGYQVTWTFGHLCTLKEPHDYRPEWKSWMIQDLPIIPERFGIKPIEIDNYKEQIEVIRRLLSQATMVVNCGDAGQEGELIQRWVLQYCGCSVPVQRLWISSLTDEAIREGFANLRSDADFRSLYEAGLSRAIGDWLLGINATRLYTSRFSSGRGNVLSIGRVQTPTLALIVQRQREIENFVPEKYWELKTVYRGVTFSAEKGKYNQKEEAQKALEAISQTDFTVKDVKKKEGKELPPKLFDLTSLQVACNRKFGMSAEETLATIQSLYERKLTTYPRVDTTYLSDDIYPKVSKILTELIPYREYTERLLSGGKIRKSKKVFDNSKVTDHHAIIPTGQPVHGLTDKEHKVFDLIARHFIAAFYPDCRISTTTVGGLAGGVKFKAVGKEILDPGWRVVFRQEEETATEEPTITDDKDDAQALPSFEIGETGPHSPELKEKQTQPPKLYTEATLLRAMETAGKLVENEELREAMKENGIGRPSTRANIIETLFKRQYIIRGKRSSIKATEIGVQLIDKIQSDLLKSAELTGQWEYKLRQIEHGTIAAADFLSELKEMVRSVVWDVLRPRPTPPAQTSTAPTPEPPRCPLCGKGYVIRGRTSYGCSAFRDGCNYRISFEDFAKQYPTQ